MKFPMSAVFLGFGFYFSFGALAITEEECRRIYARSFAEINNPKFYSPPGSAQNASRNLDICLAKVEQIRRDQEVAEERRVEYKKRVDAELGRRREEARKENEERQEIYRQRRLELNARLAKENEDRLRKQAEQDAIRATPEYKKAEAERDVAYLLKRLKELHGQLGVEREIEKRSGVVNPNLIYALTKEITELERYLEQKQAEVRLFDSEIKKKAR